MSPLGKIVSSSLSVLLPVSLMAVAKAEPKNIIVPANVPFAAPIEVPAGAVLEVLAIHGDEEPPRISADINAGGTVIPTLLQSSNHTNDPYPSKVAGPVTVTFKNPGGNPQALVTYEIKDPAAELKSNSVAIPDDGSGNYEVTLESSTDLTTWTPAAAGVHPSTTARRFFRVAVKKPAP